MSLEETQWLEASQHIADTAPSAHRLLYWQQRINANVGFCYDLCVVRSVVMFAGCIDTDTNNSLVVAYSGGVLLLLILALMSIGGCKGEVSEQHPWLLTEVICDDTALFTAGPQAVAHLCNASSQPISGVRGHQGGAFHHLPSSRTPRELIDGLHPLHPTPYAHHPLTNFHCSNCAPGPPSISHSHQAKAAGTLYRTRQILTGRNEFKKTDNRNFPLAHTLASPRRNTQDASGPPATALTLRQVPDSTLEVLADMFNSSLKVAHFPSPCKLANVIIFPKPGKDKTQPQNYRPISLLSVLSKILENVILNRLKTHSLHNTPTVRFTEYITGTLNWSHSSAAVFLDVEKAFHLLYSYLDRRKFPVTVEGATSEHKVIRAGVPQGNIQGPVLFNLYTHDIPRPAAWTAQIDVCADDTRSSDLSMVVRYAQDHLNTLEHGRKMEEACNGQIWICADRVAGAAAHLSAAKARSVSPAEHSCVVCTMLVNARHMLAMLSVRNLDRRFLETSAEPGGNCATAEPDSKCTDTRYYVRSEE
ncbi:hypothetical protein PR048_021389, partial [Dryococelus australis]